MLCSAPSPQRALVDLALVRTWQSNSCLCPVPGPHSASPRDLRKQLFQQDTPASPACVTRLSGARSNCAPLQVLVVVGYGAIRDVRVLWLDVDVVKEMYLCRPTL